MRTSNFIHLIKTHLKNIPGWKTSRKIVVLESDDWGMIRMASKEAFLKLKNKGFPVENSVYNTFDALESNTDLENLAEILLSVKDSHGHPAKFTVNNIVGNPDFKKIKESQFENYFYESFVETLRRHTNSDRVLDLYKQGINEGVFQPQFHGREHVQINNWFTKLKKGDVLFSEAFSEGMFTLNDEKGMSSKAEC